MVHSNWVRWGALAVVLGSACSDDDSGDGQPAGAAGSSSGNAGSGGDGGSAGTAMSNAGSGGEATYSAEEACQRFAEVTHDKGVECGLLINAAIPLCLANIPNALSIIADECEMAIVGPRNRADVDRCVAGIADNTCAEACSDAPFEGCEAFDELPGDGGVTCDPVMCLQD